MERHENIDLITDSGRVLGTLDGVIHIRFPRMEVRIRFWPEPFCECRGSNAQKWEANTDVAQRVLIRALRLLPTAQSSPQARFLFDYYTEDRQRPWSCRRLLEIFIAKVPLQLRQFLCQKNCLQWSLLKLAGRSREVRDLAGSNPMLLSLWLVKEHDPDNLINSESLELLRLPQRQQLEALELPQEQKWVRLLRKVPIQEIKYLRLSQLRILAMANDRKCCSYLQHRKQISAYEISAISTVNFMQYIRAKFGHLALMDILPLQLNALSRLPRPLDCKLPQFVTRPLSEARKLLISEHHPKGDLKDENWRSQLPFGCPIGWEHLNTVEKIKKEGEKQSNCLETPYNYLGENTFLFKITKPVRATACVKSELLGNYNLSECLGAHNTQLDWQHELEIRIKLSEKLSEGIAPHSDS